MCVTDCWHAYRFHNNFQHSHSKIGIVDFASILAKDCLNNSFTNENPNNIALTIDVPSPQPKSSQGDQEVGIVDEHSAVSALASLLNSPSGSKGSNKKTSATPQKTNLRNCFEGHKLVPTKEIEVYRKSIKLDNGKETTVSAERRKRARCKACKFKTS